MKHVIRFEEKYKSGIPEEDIQEVSNTLKLDIKLLNPFKQIYLEVKSEKKRYPKKRGKTHPEKIAF